MNRSPLHIPQGAYMNYLLFDGSFSFMDAGFAEVPGTGQYALLELSNIAVQQSGYLIAYLSYESASADQALFDDFRVTHTLSPVLQVDDYYPFGMTFNSYYSGIENKYLYQGKEKQEEFETYDFHARMYDPSVGRTWQLDPMLEKYYGLSPYSWVANNPIVFTDPTGMEIDWSQLKGKEHREERKQINQALREIKKSGNTGKEMVNYLKSKESGRILVTANSEGESSGVMGSFNENLKLGEMGYGGLPGFKPDEIRGILNLDLNTIGVFDEKVMDVLVEEVSHAVINSVEATAVGNNVDESAFLLGNREFAAKAIVGQVEWEQGRPIQQYTNDETARIWGRQAFSNKNTTGFENAALKWRSEQHSGSRYAKGNVDSKIPVALKKFVNGGL